MKFTLTTLSVILFVLAFEGTTFSQTLRFGCGYPTTSDNRGTYYMSCFNRLSGETTDYQRIQAAVDYIPSGKLIFDRTPDGNPYTVSQAVVLRSNMILEGTSVAATFNPASSAIKLTTSGASTSLKSVFKIGQVVYNVSIRDLGLLAESATTYTAGILAEGTNVTGTATSSLNFEFSNLKFNNFTIGIKVNALDSTHSWQFDNVQLEHCTFEVCKTGVHINSFNSGWQMNSIEIFSLANSVGIYIERGTYTAIDSVIGNLVDSTQAETFIKINNMASPITIRNCVSEGFTNDLIVNAASNTRQLTLTANSFQGNVDLKNADVVSIGNFFAPTIRDENGVLVYQGQQPIARGTTRITSIGDKFCDEGETNCVGSGYNIKESAYVVFSSSLDKNLINRPTFMNHFLDIKTDLPFEPNTPLLTLTRPTYFNFPLLRLGSGNFHYTLSRDNNGFLKFQGNQNAPYRGYNFDGPIKLPTFTITPETSLPNVLENGSMLFCSNCQAGSSPCTVGTGGGALAISIAGNWVCK